MSDSGGTPRRDAVAWRALAEAGLLGFALLAGLLLVSDWLAYPAVSSGVFFSAGLFALWAALRWRIPSGRWPRQLALETGLAALVGGLLPAGLGLALRLAGLAPALDRHSPTPGGLLWMLTLAAPLFLIFRLGLRLWLAWEERRRQRLALALTHAFLSLALLLVLITLVVFVLLDLRSGSAEAFIAPQSGTAAAVAAGIVSVVLPMLVSVSALALLALPVLGPLAAGVAYRAARRITRRLERLAQAAASLRRGDLSARVPVEGEDEVAGLQITFNEMAAALELGRGELQAERDRVQRLLEERRALFAYVSHELRTPVATIAAYLDADLEAGPALPPKRLQHDLLTLRGETTRLQALIDDLFTLAQAEVDRLKVDCQPTDPCPVVQRTVEAFQPFAWQSGRVTVVADLTPDIPPVSLDENRLAQILGNLLRNAVRHTRPGGIVAVQLSADAASVTLAVHDTGEGIPPADLAHIWEPFYQGERERGGDHLGAGIGLALVRELAAAMGAQVSVESIPGQGSSFRVRFSLT